MAVNGHGGSNEETLSSSIVGSVGSSGTTNQDIVASAALISASSFFQNSVPAKSPNSIKV